MGYSTSFTGRFLLDEPLTAEQLSAIKGLAGRDVREGCDLGDGFRAPSNYCDWVPSKDGKGVEWNGGEKFYSYVEWLELIIGRYLKPWGHTLSGRVGWQGEEGADQGVIHVRANRVQAIKNVIVKPEPFIEKPEPDFGGEA
jgi:hypothetical protein